MNSINRLNEMIKECKNIVFFGGAGVSTESGIKDFRSADGIYSMDYKYSPEEVLSHTFYETHTEDFYDFYRKYLCFPNAKPNKAHFKLAELEKSGKLRAVITQNVDGLHQIAGSKNVFELHGSALRNYCVKCGKFHDFNSVYLSEGIPRCDCGGIIKPDVVLYKESLNDKIIYNAINAISEADMLIVAGTSLKVYPAAGFIRNFKGKHIVIINLDKTEMDSDFGLVIHDKVGEVLDKIKI